MLELKNITKEYRTGEETVQALKGINLKFRSNEFVSILGQSGSGKTTMLNIIGGLDQYTSGDLLINEKSTKDFKEKDWDTYRNHSVGFIFQSYNLIPHQSVLSNVELALTLSGVSKEERRERAREVLTKVGLKDHINKRPNQLSGGQMQRVAIARALINDPEILLADEPTGALDSETSEQIMSLLKEIASDRLVIMVTHNPDLAEEYSTRIIKVLDGEILEDSNPATAIETRDSKVLKSEKTFMSFFTALGLSFNNLLTKKGRTILTAFAGSIGIIGIALILSLSNGVQNYISRIEEDTLSSYPLTIEESTLDMSVIMQALMGVNMSETDEVAEGKVTSTPIMTDVMDTLSNRQGSNNLEKFKEFLETDSRVSESTNAIQYGYNIPINIYSEDSVDGVIQVNPSQVMENIGMGQMMGDSSNPLQSAMTGGSMASSQMNIWKELLDNPELLETQYDTITGRWPEKHDEVILIVDENNSVSDYMLYALGLLSQEKLADNFESIINGEEIDPVDIPEYSYDELMDMTFQLILNTDMYEKEGDIWMDRSDDEEFMEEVVANSESLKIVGIMRPNEEAITGQETGSIGYTSDLKEHVITQTNDSEIVQEQKENPDVNVFTGLEFPEETGEGFDMANLTDEQRAYMASLSEEELAELISTYQENADATYEANLTTLGAVDLDKPSQINIFAKDFETKEQLEDLISEYNTQESDAGREENVITYSDLVGTMMSSVTSIINIISYVLIAFVGVSLIVSSIMIGIITYISVLERTKEIGILRSVGASKKDISRVFNAETFIIGLLSGVLGIGITVLLNIPINIVIKNMTGISGIASLPPMGGVALILISLILTVIAGIIPSRMAAKKDPVEALRTE
ncbi:ABC transporter ATP-binding protein/permease [Jeotgalibaca ciconiae]|uniref:ABC transporter ATP-binding protein/permease n=1 Tax=Jeotgalibaca ciconiae TaxID=2496265 RepID=A0A3Q9BJS0_9LACT|nr:ABC transporter ATP-binding protein/permease [Jeotgalibaca ciconiae]AZP03979.1 ABC transporter ATP-binding protein/permease [Jeotgalibaca ciconiae]